MLIYYLLLLLAKHIFGSSNKFEILGGCSVWHVNVYIGTQPKGMQCACCCSNIVIENFNATQILPKIYFNIAVFLKILYY